MVLGISNITYSLIASKTGFCPSKPDFVSVKVLAREKPFIIPNVFTPNNDGINDVWVIRELAGYPAATVDVFTRYGRQVFTAIGYKKPWDGTLNGTALPTGVYYYVIVPKPKAKPLSGWVTILR
jgi:gliding motility-associated-like protein